jgi:hypothetical protein
VNESLTILQTDHLPIPASAEAVTADWLDGVLRAAGVLADARVAALDVEQVAAGTGGGFFTDLMWLRPRYDPAALSAPKSLVLKHPLAAPDAFLVSRYEREVNFYRRLAGETPVRTPRCYFARFDPSTGRFALLLEDLAELKPGDELKSCSQPEAEAAMRTIARHHPAFWGRDGLEAALVAQPMPWRPPSPAMWERLETDFVGRWPKIMPEVVAATRERLTGLQAFMAEGPHTLLHGDFRLDNLMFDAAANAASPEVVLLDWQMTRSGRAPADLAWMLGLAVTTENRRRWQDGLLHLYNDELSRNGVTGHSFEDCLRDFRLSLLTTLASAALGWTVTPKQGKAIEKFTQFVLRISNTIVDNDALSALLTAVPSGDGG